VFSVYGLVARFGLILDTAVTKEWEKQKATLPEELDEDEQVAIETGLSNGLRARLFADIERATRNFAVPRLTAGDLSARVSLGAAIDRLEHDVSLLRLNMNESVALEDFLLASLRTWSRK
jgi:DNA polymerase-3 subunit delta'